MLQLSDIIFTLYSIHCYVCRLQRIRKKLFSHWNYLPKTTDFLFERITISVMKLVYTDIDVLNVHNETA